MKNKILGGVFLLVCLFGFSGVKLATVNAADCNEPCTAVGVAECVGGLVCNYIPDYGDVCRLPSNPTSPSCSGGSVDAVPCNGTCTRDANGYDCIAGMMTDDAICWNIDSGTQMGTCRLKSNPTNETCSVAPPSTGQITVVPNPAISPAHPIITWTTTGASDAQCECTGAVPIARGSWFASDVKCKESGLVPECTASGYDFKWFGELEYPATGTETCTCYPINASDGNIGIPFSATFSVISAPSSGQITVAPVTISPAHPLITWTTTGASNTQCECTGAVPIAPGGWYKNNDECYRAGVSAECTSSGYDFKWFGELGYPATGTETCTCKPVNASDGNFGTPFSATFSVISAPPPIIYACNTPEPPAGGKRCAGTAETGFSSTVSWSKVGTCTAGGQCEYTVCTPNPQCVQGDCSSQCGGSVLYYCRDIAGCTATPICSSDCSKQMTACSACSSGEWREVAP